MCSVLGLIDLRCTPIAEIITFPLTIQVKVFIAVMFRIQKLKLQKAIVNSKFSFTAVGDISVHMFT
jgi:hypothetical protein